MKNLEIYLKKIDYSLIFYFIFIFIIPAAIGIKFTQFYHLINISLGTIIFFYGFFFKRKSYYFKIIIIFSLLFFLTLQSDYFNSKSLVFFYYFFIIFFSSLIIIESFSIEQIIKTYCIICYILSIYAIYEFFNPFEIFEIGRQLEPRANSIFREPSHFASMIVPSLGYYLKDIKKNLLQLFIIFIASIITFSITSYLLLSLIFVIYFLNFIKSFNKNLFILFILILFFVLLILLNLDLSLISDRYLLTLSTFFNLESVNYNKNLTLWSVITSIKVNAYTFMNYPYGIGLGNFNSAYYDSLSEFFYDYSFLYGPNHINDSDAIFWFSKTIGFNENAHSLLFRLFSEIGIFSLIFFGLFIYFIFSTFNQERDLFAIYVVVIVFIFAKFLKVSSYFLFGTPIFLVLFIYLNINSIMKKKFNKNLIYLPFIFMIIFFTSFYVLNKIKNEKIYNIKIYSSLETSDYLFSLDGSIRNNFKNLKNPILIDIDHKERRAILSLKYISDQKIELTKLDKFLRDEFDEFKQTKLFDQNQVNSYEEFFRYDLSKMYDFLNSDSIRKFFINNQFIYGDKKKRSDKELLKITNMVKAKGIDDLNFLNNLNNIYSDDLIKENILAKKKVLLENLYNSQLLFLQKNRHPNMLLSILINYYSNPNNMNIYTYVPDYKIYKLILNENKINLNFNLHLISLIISIFTCIAFIILTKKIQK